MTRKYSPITPGAPHCIDRTDNIASSRFAEFPRENDANQATDIAASCLHDEDTRHTATGVSVRWKQLDADVWVVLCASPAMGKNVLEQTRQNGNISRVIPSTRITGISHHVLLLL